MLDMTPLGRLGRKTSTQTKTTLSPGPAELDMPCLCKSEDPDQLASQEDAELDLHCLSLSM